MSVPLRSTARSIGRRLTYANVASTLALVMVMGTGTAYAINTVRSKDIVNGQVKPPDIATNAVSSVKIRDNGITAMDLGFDIISSGSVIDGSLTQNDLAADSVGTSEVENNSLTTADIAGADVNGGGISIPAGYVPDGRCRQVDASVGGAKAGEAVVFNIKAPIQDGILIYGQRVPSDGHVMYDVCNFTGGAMVAIVNLPVRVITFG
jgi:hypothetical protein